MAVSNAVVSDDAQIETPEFAVLSVGEFETTLSLSDVYKLRSGLLTEAWEHESAERTATARALKDLRQQLAPIAYGLGGRNETVIDQTMEQQQ